MRRYENKTFNGGEVLFDNSEFINCVFKDCVIVYSSGPFKLDGGYRLDNVRFQIDGTAANGVLQFLRFMNLQDPQLIRDLLDVSQSPGTRLS